MRVIGFIPRAGKRESARKMAGPWPGEGFTEVREEDVGVGQSQQASAGDEVRLARDAGRTRICAMPAHRIGFRVLAAVGLSTRADGNSRATPAPLRSERP
jgi:hypothetical protein